MSLLALVANPLVLIAEVILLVVALRKIRPVHRRASTLAAAGMGLALASSLGGGILQVLAVWWLMQPGAGGGPSGPNPLDFALLGISVMVGPMGQGLGMLALAASFSQLAARLQPEDPDDLA